MSFPPMRYNEAEELYGARPIEPAIADLLTLFYSHAADVTSQLHLSVACAKANRQVMGDLYEDLVPMGLDVAFSTQQVRLEQVIDLVHKAVAFGEAKMLSRITAAAQYRALRDYPVEGCHVT